MGVSLPSNECLVSVTKVSDYCIWFHDAYSSFKADNFSTNDETSHLYGLLLWSEKLITWIQSKLSTLSQENYVCVCVCVCVCMYVECTNVCMYVYMYVCIYVCMYVCVCVCMYTHTHIYILKYAKGWCCMWFYVATKRFRLKSVEILELYQWFKETW